MTDKELSARVAELEQALHREREVSAAERRRCELLEESVRHAYRFAVNGAPREQIGDPADAQR